MNTLDDLHTLVRLLAEFELPVSPILEYAIKNKEEELMNTQQEQPLQKPVKETKKKVKMKVMSEVPDEVKISKRKASVLRVYRQDNSFIEEVKAAATMCKAIKEIGAEKVFDMRIPMDGMYLVTHGGNPQYPTAQHDVGNGLFVNVHSNNITKKRQLERIFDALNLNWKVEILES